MFFRGAVSAHRTTPAAVLYFVEQEPGVEPYRTRMIVTAGFLAWTRDRTAGFLLFDRADGSIYSVSSARNRYGDSPAGGTEAVGEIHAPVQTDPARFPPLKGARSRITNC
jgi:hypothetical protein